MSFLTCFCDFAQKLHLTSSPPSPNFATSPAPPRRPLRGRTLRGADRCEGGFLPRGDDLVDEPVGDGLVGGHDEVAVRVLLDAIDRLAGVVAERLGEEVTHPQDLLGLDLDVR